MIPQIARYITGSERGFCIISTLEELALYYSPKDIEVRKLRRLSDSFRLIVLESPDDIIHLVEDSYIKLKTEYLQSGNRNYIVNSWIQCVDSMLVLH